MQNHSEASYTVAAFGHMVKMVANFMAYPLVEQQVVSTLVYPGEGYRISVTFSRVLCNSNIMRVRATNWRCEDEPNGFYEIATCRAFYEKLLRAGFVKEA